MSSGPYFLGLHIGHDRAITLADQSEIFFHTAVERLDRRKHSDSYHIPFAEISEILRFLQLDISEVVGTCISYHAVNSDLVAGTLEAEFRKYFPTYAGRFNALDHHLAHALGAKSCSSFDEALVLVADGAGDQRLWGTQSESLFHVSDEAFYLLEDRVQSYPLTRVHRPEFYDPSFFRPDDARRQISLGLKYEQVTYLCGFGPGQEGQTMALAAFGRPLFDLSHLLPTDLAFSLTYTDLIREIAHLAKSEGTTLREFADAQRANIAATVQRFLEESVTRICGSVLEKYRPKHVCFSGGIFLNCPTNRRVLDMHTGVDLYFSPACNDEGQSLGTASYAFWLQKGCLPRVSREFPYLGRHFDQLQCNNAYLSAGLTFEQLNDEDLAGRIAVLLSQGKIVGLLRGRSETGPRALGHRSILADPSSAHSKTRLDAGIKRRATFRPYAPILLQQHAAHYTDLDADSPYMLLTARVCPDTTKLLKAVTHVDGSTRVQTVRPSADPFIGQLLAAFFALTGVPGLLNTSFNDEREPIVDTPLDAIRIFSTTNLDVLVMGNSLHVRRE